MVQSHHQGSDRYSEGFPELGLTYLAEVEWTTPKPARVHAHPEHQFLWVLGGRMIMETLGQRYEETTGGLFVLPAGQPHLVVAPPAQPRLHFIDLRLRLDTPGTLAHYLISQNEPRLYLPEKAAYQLAANLRVALAGPVGPISAVPFKAARVHAVLWEALSAVRKEQRTAGPTEPGQLHLRAAETAMRKRLAEQVQVSALAKEAGLSRSQLTRIFLRQSGVGPAERLRQMRIEKACELLRGSTRSVKEIAHACGFVCPNHFCRVFRNEVHATPTKYRLEYEGG